MHTPESTESTPKDSSPRFVDLYSWWLYEGNKNPVCIVDKVCKGIKHEFRCTHVKTLRICESNPTWVPIDEFWRLVDAGTIQNVTKGREVTVREPVAQ